MLIALDYSMHTSEKSFGRRDFLRKVIALAPVLSIATCAPISKIGASSRQLYLPKYFTRHEWDFVSAACERLIPKDENGPGAVETGVPQFIDLQMDGAFGHAATWYMQEPFAAAIPELGYQSPLTPREVYRAGIAEVESYCKRMFSNRSFAKLPDATQDSVLSDLETGNLDFTNVSGKAFFAFLLQNTKEGYLADPAHGGNIGLASWKMIGFPGARADFKDWINRHGERYVFGPVSIDGRRK